MDISTIVALVIIGAIRIVLIAAITTIITVATIINHRHDDHHGLQKWPLHGIHAR